MNVLAQAKKAKAAFLEFRKARPLDREQALLNMALHLENNVKNIIEVNKEDLKAAQEKEYTKAFLDRLQLTTQRIEQMILSVRDVAAQNDVLGILHDRHTRPDGLMITRERIPLGVIGMIFEGRPNVITDASALGIKSGNALLLKGGREAKNSNEYLGGLVRESIKNFVPQDVVQVLDSTDRESIGELLTLHEWIDVIVPRGGEGLIKFVYEHSRIPVIAHFKGLCHLYLHEDAEEKVVLDVCMNAKVSRPSVCNALETLLVHQNIDPQILKDLIFRLEKVGVEIRACAKTRESFPHLKAATEEDWQTEYLDYILSIKTVANEEEAISHIQQYGTRHTEGICASNREVIEKFQQSIDASCIVINASTRFNDGGELGLGAELGISTSKLHAYGPMGAKEMTTTRYVVEGKGHIR